MLLLLLPFTPPEDDVLFCCCSTLLLSDSFPPSKQLYRRDNEKSLRSRGLSHQCRIVRGLLKKLIPCPCYYFTMLSALVLFEFTDFLVKTLLTSLREVKAKICTLNALEGKQFGRDWSTFLYNYKSWELLKDVQFNAAMLFKNKTLFLCLLL